MDSLNKSLLNPKYNTIIVFLMIVIFIIYGIIMFINDLYDDKCGDGNDDCTYAPSCEEDDAKCNNIGEENDIRYDDEL